MDTASGTGRRMKRQSSDRLRMHAPSSLKVAHADSADVAAWKPAIPLLSPLDAASSRIWDAAQQQQQDAAAAAAAREQTAEKKAEAAGPTAWTHPAAPFYYGPAAPGAGPANFLLPHCA